MSKVVGGKRKLTYEEYRLFHEDGRRHEIIDGDHFVNPAPGTYHQRLSRRIQFAIYSQVEAHGVGEVFNAPTDVQLSDTDVVQPDLVVVLVAHVQLITPTKIKGIPDLIVEILSPSNADYDRRLKKALYERSGVPEYWVVDPTERRIDQFVLKDGVYTLFAAVEREIRCATIANLVIDLTKVW